jgi:hypothetical protein
MTYTTKTTDTTDTNNTTETNNTTKTLHKNEGKLNSVILEYVWLGADYVLRSKYKTLYLQSNEQLTNINKPLETQVKLL